MLANETLGDFVRRTRDEGRWSREDVVQRAKRAGHKISQSYIQQIEGSEIKSPSVEKLTALAVGLGIARDDLMKIIDREAKEAGAVPARLLNPADAVNTLTIGSTENGREFGRLLSRYRALRNISLRELGDLVNISFSHIQKMESGERNPPDREDVIRIAQALEAEVNEFLHAANYRGQSEGGPSIHLPELEHLSAAQRDRVEAAAREAAQEEIKKIRSSSSGDAIARMLAELPEDMDYPPTAKELKYLAMIPPDEWEHTELDPRSMSPLWLHPPGGARLNEIKEAALERGVEQDAPSSNQRS